MAAFDYEALDQNGRKKKGVVSADNARAARRQLREQHLTPLKVEASSGEARAGSSSSGEAAAANKRTKLGSREVTMVTRQLAMLLRAGSPLEEALNAVSNQVETRAARSVLLSTRAQVAEGFRFSDALGKHPKSFTTLYRAMTAAGEGSGELGPVMERLADVLESDQAMQRKLLTATIYPIVLAIVAALVVTALMVFVVPRVVEQFETLGQELPLVTVIVISISEFLRGYGLFLLAGIAGGIILLGRAMAVPATRRPIDGLLLKVPLAGRWARSVAAARFARTFGSLISAGTPVLDALTAAKQTLGNLVLQDAVDDMATAVREGGNLSGAMKASGVFPPLLVYMAASGERSGELALMFEKAAEYLEGEFEATTAVALNLLEPGIIVVMGGMVVVIVLSIMLPILQLNTMALG